MEIRGRVLVVLLVLAFFAVGYASISIAKERAPVFRYKPLNEFVIGHYPIDVFKIQGKTRDDFNRMVQELKSIGPDALHKMVIAGFASEEHTKIYNFNLGDKRAFEMRDALKKIFPSVEIDTYTDGERHNIRQVKVYVGVSCDDISAKYLRPLGDKLVLCDSVTFKVDRVKVTMTVNLAQNGIELEPGEIVRAHTMTRNHEFGHEGDVASIGKLTGDGRLVLQWRKSERNLMAITSDGYYVERIWVTVNRGESGKWFVFCSQFLEPDKDGFLAIQLMVSSDSVEPINTDQFLDRATRSGTVSYVYREKKKEYYGN